MTAHLTESLSQDPFWQKVVVHVDEGLKTYGYEDYYVLISLEESDLRGQKTIGDGNVRMEVDHEEQSVDCVVANRAVSGNINPRNFAMFNIVDTLDAILVAKDEG